MIYRQEHGIEADLANDVRKIGDMTLMDNGSTSVEVQNGNSSPSHSERERLHPVSHGVRRGGSGFELDRGLGITGIQSLTETVRGDFCW